MWKQLLTVEGERKNILSVYLPLAEFKLFQDERVFVGIELI